MNIYIYFKLMKILILIFLALSLAKEDYYKILGLTKGADLESVKK